MRWLEAPRLPAWPLVLPPELPTPLPRPPPLGQGQRGCKQLLRPNGSGGSEEERRRWLRRVDGPFVLDPPPPPVGAEEAGSQKRQRTAGEAEETDSQAQGA
jgi:hypothetical protein